MFILLATVLFVFSLRALRLPMNHKIKSKPITELGSKQLLTYLKLKGLRLSFVLNFGGNLMKDGIERIVNGLCDANLGSAMSKKYAISRKSFVQPQSILLLSIAFLSGSGP